MKSPDVPFFDCVTSSQRSLFQFELKKKLAEGNPFPVGFSRNLSFLVFFGQNVEVLSEHIFEFVYFGGLKKETQKFELLKRQKSRFLRTTGMKLKILSDRTSSFSVFFDRTYFFVTKQLPIRNTFLKLFCSKNELLDSKLRRLTNIRSIEKIFSPCCWTHPDTVQLFFFPTSNCLRKLWKTCSKLSDWLISKAPHSASRCPPGCLQMLSIP